MHNTYTNFGPRVGIAYRTDPKTVIRSGFGIFYDNFAASAQRSQSFAGNWPDNALQIQTALNRATATQLTPTVTISNMLSSNLPQATPFGRTQRYVDPYLKNPYSMQWNFGVQHQFLTNTVLDINYVGSGSRRLSLADYTNVALTPGPGTPALRRPYPNIASTYFETSSGISSYHALQAQFVRRFENGLQFQFSYTWSKSIDLGCSGFLE